MERARVAMETGTHSIWVSEQIRELGHEVIVANVRELRAISHSDRKSDKVDAEKIARYARLDPEILRPIAHRAMRRNPQRKRKNPMKEKHEDQLLTQTDLLIETPFSRH